MTTLDPRAVLQTLNERAMMPRVGLSCFREMDKDILALRDAAQVLGALLDDEYVQEALAHMAHRARRAAMTDEEREAEKRAWADSSKQLDEYNRRRRETHVTTQSAGRARIKEWVDSGGEMCWRDEVRYPVPGRTDEAVALGTTAHVWLGHETLCGHDFPREAVVHSHLPGPDGPRLCGSCASVAGRRGLPVRGELS